MAVLAKLDESIRDAFNRFACRLQEGMGLTMPQILQQAATATILATALSIFAAAILRGPATVAVVLVFGGMTIASMWRLLLRYARDAERDWNSDLARDYMVRAIGATEGQRRIREIGLVFSLLSLALSVIVYSVRPFDIVDLTMIVLVLSTMAHMYLACAEPRPPGTRRREAKLALAGGLR